jgi:hypothetical protein
MDEPAITSKSAWSRRLFFRLLRWRIRLRYMQTVPKIGIGLIGAITLAGVPLWRHFGTNICLPVLADLTPVLLES